MMQTKSFLPDNQTVICSVLVHLPYKRKDMEKISAGTNPALLPVMNNSDITWGLLYLGETEMGVFIHPPTSPIMQLFSNAANTESDNAVYFHLPYTQIKETKILHPPVAKNIIGKIFLWLTSKEEDRCIIKWNEEFTLECFITTDSAEFEKKLKEYTGNL